MAVSLISNKHWPHLRSRSTLRRRVESEVHRAGAFTLLELMVVIGIVAVVLGVLLPVLASARESARCLQCATNVRTILQCWIMYANDNHGILPACGNGETWPATDTNLVYYQVDDDTGNIEFDHGMLMPYVSAHGTAPRQAIFRCPMVNAPPGPNLSYVFSAELSPEDGPKQLTQIHHAAEKIPVIEQLAPDNDANFDPDDGDDTDCVRHYHKGNAKSGVGKGNYGFADGHVAAYSLVEINAHREWLHIFRP